MSNGLNRRQKPEKVVDIKAKYQETIEADRLKCSEEINTALAAHNMQFTVYMQIGDQLVPLDQIIKLPIVIQVTVK